MVSSWGVTIKKNEIIKNKPNDYISKTKSSVINTEPSPLNVSRLMSNQKELQLVFDDFFYHGLTECIFNF